MEYSREPIKVCCCCCGRWQEIDPNTEVFGECFMVCDKCFNAKEEEEIGIAQDS